VKKDVLLLLFIFVNLALILITTTDILTLFVGSHSIVDITSGQNDISCVDCHQQIQNELNDSEVHSDLSCEACHRFNGTGIVFATHNTTGVYAGKEAHASYTPPCLDCHGESGVYITNKTGVSKFAPPAPEFNETYGSENSTHKVYVEASIGYGLSVGENEACISCHTNYSMKFEFKRPEYIQYDVVDTNSGINSKNWEIQNFVRASDNATVVWVNRTGSKHQWIDSSDINCFDCHSDLITAVENGGHISSSLDPTGGPGNKVNGHAGRFHNFSRSDVDISICEPCHLSNSSNFEWDHSGHAQLDYHAATTEHCKQCHKYGAEKAIDSGFCICPCHSALASNGNDRCYGNSFPF
jgi:nitrate/TMAO reductase-like tetraheme cytochrome c subunit